MHDLKNLKYVYAANIVLHTGRSYQSISILLSYLNYKEIAFGRHFKQIGIFFILIGIMHVNPV